jgi:hypothetical protein
MQRLAKGFAACVVAVLALSPAMTAAAAKSTRASRAATRCTYVKKTRSHVRVRRCRHVRRPRRVAKWSASRRGDTRMRVVSLKGSTSQQTKQALSPTGVPTSTSWAGWNVLSNPIDPRQQSAVPFGYRSDWLQPWRAYMDTQPGSMMRDALGINFNVDPPYASATAQFLSGVGFKRARIDIDWSAMSYANPSQFADPARWDTMLGALHAAGIRPLILLNANDSMPGPMRTFNAQITQPVAAGSRTVQVDAASAQQFVPGLSGFNVPGGTAAAFIATSVSPSGQVTLSQPLPVAIPAGTYAAATLRYQPFASPFTASGQPNPVFEQTLSGWLQYVKTVTQEAKKVFGSDHFDVEIWNELSFGSAFLSASNYYNPLPASMQGTGSVQDQLLARTVAWLRDPANGVPNVGIGDGFSNQTPYASGATVPAGTTAIDKHPYYGGVKPMPGFAGAIADQRDVDALGTAEGVQSANGNWSRPFLPTYRSFFPEYFLTAIQTDFMERDLAPTTTMIGNIAHGRTVTPAGATTPPQVWVTEDNFRPNDGAPSVNAAQFRHIQAKAALRILSAFVNEGVTALDFYAVNDGAWSMVDPNASGGGETMQALKRYMQAFAGPTALAQRRSLTLQSIADQGNWSQFAGDGTAAHPPLYNRNVVTFFPFQTDTNKFVIPVYVMTRDMGTVLNRSAAGGTPAQYDLPAQTYRLTVGGLNISALKASATDPDTGASVPAKVVAAANGQATIEMPLTDSPRLLVLQDG